MVGREWNPRVVEPRRWELRDWGSPRFALPKPVLPSPKVEPPPIPGCYLGVGEYTAGYETYGREEFPIYRQEPVYLLDQYWSYHIYLIGKTRWGKSNTILNLVQRDQRVGAGFFLIDVDGKLTRDVVARTTRADLTRLRVIEIDHRHPIGINFFDCADRRNPDAVGRTVSRVVNVFRKAWGDNWGPRMAALLRNTAHAFVANPGANLAHAPAFFEDAGVRRRMLRRVTNQQALTYWARYDRLTPASQLQWNEPVLNKIWEWLEHETLNRVFSSPETTVDLHGAMVRGEQLILLLPDNIGDDVRALVGAYFVDLLLEATFDRHDLPESSWRPFHIYADEYQEICTPTTARFLKRTAKYNVGLLIAHQTRHPDLDAENLSATLQVGTIVVFASDDRSMRDVAGHFRDTDGRELANLPRFTAKVRLADTPIQYTVRTRKADPELWDEAATAEHLAAIRERSRALFRQRLPDHPEPPDDDPETGIGAPEPPEYGVGDLADRPTAKRPPRRPGKYVG